MTRHINDTGFDLVAEFEGLNLEVYRDVGGIWTIGYGHTKGVTEDTRPISQDQADDFLDDDLENAERIVSELIKVELTDNQFSALVSLTFNVGPAPLQRTLGTVLNSGDYAKAADQFPFWNHVGGKAFEGLTRRREAERNLFLT